ncbi:MAG: hypothetical protein JOZ54_12090 [Acidobacteria bacterium]|nr:hypothetical protein [Acidobacteriota bacterium]
MRRVIISFFACACIAYSAGAGTVTCVTNGGVTTCRDNTPVVIKSKPADPVGTFLETLSKREDERAQRAIEEEKLQLLREQTELLRRQIENSSVPPQRRETEISRTATPLPASSNFFTGGVLNGWAWATMDMSTKAAYVRGFLDAAFITDGGAITAEFAQCHCSPETVALGVESFFALPPSKYGDLRRLPISFAMKMALDQIALQAPTDAVLHTAEGFMAKLPSSP